MRLRTQLIITIWCVLFTMFVGSIIILALHPWATNRLIEIKEDQQCTP